jgi:hypothetical protein
MQYLHNNLSFAMHSAIEDADLERRGGLAEIDT